MDVGSFFFLRNVPFQTSVVFLTIHDTFLTARGRRVFFVAVFCVFFGCPRMSVTHGDFCAVLQMSERCVNSNSVGKREV